MTRRPMRSDLGANLNFSLPIALIQYYMRLQVFLQYSFVPLSLNVSISDAAPGSASQNGPNLGRSPSQYFNSQNGSASFYCVTFIRPSIYFSDVITDALIADLHTKSSFLHARDCCSWGTLHYEDKRNDSENDEINMIKK